MWHANPGYRDSARPRGDENEPESTRKNTFGPIEIVSLPIHQIKTERIDALAYTTDGSELQIGRKRVLWNMSTPVDVSEVIPSHHYRDGNLTPGSGDTEPQIEQSRLSPGDQKRFIDGFAYGSVLAGHEIRRVSVSADERVVAVLTRATTFSGELLLVFVRKQDCASGEKPYEKVYDGALNEAVRKVSDGPMISDIAVHPNGGEVAALHTDGTLLIFAVNVAEIP